VVVIAPLVVVGVVNVAVDVVIIAPLVIVGLVNVAIAVVVADDDSVALNDFLFLLFLLF